MFSFVCSLLNVKKNKKKKHLQNVTYAEIIIMATFEAVWLTLPCVLLLTHWGQ